MAMDYKTASLDEIIEWCKANNQVEWLKAKAQEKTECKIYPKITITEVDKETGETIEKKKVDKTATPTIEMRPITFMQIKLAFFEKFMPEFIPTAKEKPKKATMYDKIAAL